MNTQDGNPGWNIDKTINLPSVVSLMVVAVTGIWWLGQLQAQVNQNAQEMAAWKVTWTQFTQARELVVRNYEQRMTTQENTGHEIMRRLDEIRAEQLRVGENLLRREEEIRSRAPRP